MVEDGIAPPEQTIAPTPIVSTSTAYAPTIRAFKPLTDDHPCYALVGRIAAEQARIEHLLDGIIANLADLDEATAACVTGQMVGMFPRYSALFQLAHQCNMPPKIKEEVSNLRNRSGDIGEKRNRAVHDPWLEEIGSGSPYQHKGKAKANVAYGPAPVTELELLQTLSKLQSHRQRVFNLREAVWAATHPSP
jgi:hypothetical protein